MRIIATEAAHHALQQRREPMTNLFAHHHLPTCIWAREEVVNQKNQMLNDLVTPL